MRPSLASTADAYVKIAGVLDGFAQTREFLRGQGFTPSEVESIASQLKAGENQRALLAIMGGAKPTSTTSETVEGYADGADSARRARLPDEGDQRHFRRREGEGHAGAEKLDWRDVPACRDAVVQVMQMVLSEYGAASAQAAADFYDAVRTASVGEQMGAVAHSGLDPKATEGALRAFVKDAVEGKRRYVQPQVP